MSIYKYKSLIKLEFLLLSRNVINSETEKSKQFFFVRTPLATNGLILNKKKLNTKSKELFDEGDLVPELATYWLEVCSKIINYSLLNNKISIMCIPSKKLFIPLSTSDLCSQIFSDIWLCPAEVILAWGVDQDIYQNKTFPFGCEGAVFPIIEGLGICWKTNTNDFMKLSLMSIRQD